MQVVHHVRLKHVAELLQCKNLGAVQCIVDLFEINSEDDQADKL